MVGIRAQPTYRLPYVHFENTRRSSWFVDVARVQHTFACVAIDVRDADLARRTLLTLCGRERVGRARMEARAMEEEHADGKEGVRDERRRS